MSFIYATKNGIRRKFTQMSWNLMGSDKGGWVADTAQTIQNEVKRPTDNGTDPKAEEAKAKAQAQADKEAADKIIADMQAQAKAEAEEKLRAEQEAEAKVKADAAAAAALAQNQTIQNEVTPVQPVVIEDETKIGSITASPEFIVATNDLTRPQVKDFLDSKDIKYAQNSGMPKLIDLLATHFNNDVAALKEVLG